MTKKQLTKKQLVAETVRLLEELKYNEVRPARVGVSLYKGCRKIGHTMLVWAKDGKVICNAKKLDGDFCVLFDNQLNSGDINRIYQSLKEERSGTEVAI